MTRYATCVAFVLMSLAALAARMSEDQVRSAVGRWANTDNRRAFGMRRAKIADMRTHRVGARAFHEVRFEGEDPRV